MLRPKPLGYQWKSEAELLEHARTLEGHKAGEVAALVGIRLSAETKRGRTGVGDIAQRFLGKAEDNEQRPDISELGIEVKSIPLWPDPKGRLVKEPTSITKIDPELVVAQTWQEAYVQTKIARVLWVPYVYAPAVSAAEFRRPFLWSPSALDLSAFEEDYERVRSALATTSLADISESICRVMGARRKDKKGGVGRAWALKVAFTDTLVKSEFRHGTFTSLASSLGTPSDISSLEVLVQKRLATHVGKSLAEIARRTGGEIGGGKSGPAAFVRKLLGVDGRGGIAEFERFGVRIHTVWAEPASFKLYEQVSFPRMSLTEFAQEEWPDAELMDHIDRILFIPLLSRGRLRDQRVLGRPFFWSPTPMDLSIIKAEWTKFQKLVNAGDARYETVRDQRGQVVRRRDGKAKRENKLPGSSQTQRIHMRPHAANAADEDVDPQGNRVTGQSFWLNGEFVAEILRSNLPLLSPGRP